MILSNQEILNELKREYITIDTLNGDESPDKDPFNPTSIDLKLSDTIYMPKENSLAVDLYEKDDTANLLDDNCNTFHLGEPNGKGVFILRSREFILGMTKEKVSFPIRKGGPNFAARIEGKSSRARCGLIIHCTSPTIHAGFEGQITLEISNLSPWPFLLYPDMYICQLIIEKVEGEVVQEKRKSRYHEQNTATGKRTEKGKRNRGRVLTKT